MFFNFHSVKECWLLFQTIGDILDLNLPAEDNQREKKYTHYSHGQLCEVQSKLMLVAGKQQENNVDVSRFVEACVGY